MSNGIALGRLIEAFRATARDNASLAIGAVAGLTIGNLALDSFASQQASTFIGSIAQFMAQVIVTRWAMQRRTGAPLPPNVAGFFLLNLLGSIGVLAGLALLVLPGLYLAARWLVAGPILLVEREGPIAAMERSWHLTAPMAWPLATLLALLWVPALLLAFGGGLLATFAYEEAASQTNELIVSGLLYLMMSVVSVASWLAAVAAYNVIRPEIETLEDIFA